MFTVFCFYFFRNSYIASKKLNCSCKLYFSPSKFFFLAPIPAVKIWIVFKQFKGVLPCLLLLSCGWVLWNSIANSHKQLEMLYHSLLIYPLSNLDLFFQLFLLLKIIILDFYPFSFYWPRGLCVLIRALHLRLLGVFNLQILIRKDFTAEWNQGSRCYTIYADLPE